MELHSDTRTVVVLSTHDRERDAVAALLSPYGFRVLEPRQDESPRDAVERTGAGALLVSGSCEDTVLHGIVAADSEVFVPVLIFGTRADHGALKLSSAMLNLPYAELDEDGDVVVRLLALTGGQKEVN
ncbi:MAG TPA: hypothetical protein VEA99_18820 [Gemmatimonadaceae bacterium]|nr:hypothetical protein [Gemmatimonadaceae bacterium]